MTLLPFRKLKHQSVTHSETAQNSVAAPTGRAAHGMKSTPKIGGRHERQLKRLSVLVPLYNNVLSLRRLIERVFDGDTSLDIELIVVDDGSRDQSWKILCEMASDDNRIKLIRHRGHFGKGAALRTAIGAMTGDVAMIQVADPKYEPAQFAKLLTPILEDGADAVFGSRYLGQSRLVLPYWPHLANRLATGVSNLFNDLSLTDIGTGYKMVRAEVLKNLNLQCKGDAFDAELTARLAQWGAALFEVPISYSENGVNVTKKMNIVNAFRSVCETLRCRLFNKTFTQHSGFAILTAVSHANRYNRWTLQKITHFMGNRLLEAGAGIGNMSRFLLDRSRLVLVDYEPLYVSRLAREFGVLDNTRIEQMDISDALDVERLLDEGLDGIYCSNVLEHIEDDVSVLRNFFKILQPGGHCIIGVPAGMWLYSDLDRELGHHRRYSIHELCEKMEAAGFEVVFEEQFNRFGSLGWFLSGKVFRRKRLSARQMLTFDYLLPVAKILDYLLPVPGITMFVVGRKPLEGENTRL